MLRARHPFHIDAWVVLPEHMHCMWTLPEGDADFALRWKVIKFGFSRRLPNQEALSATQHRRGERAIWQRRYWERKLPRQADTAKVELPARVIRYSAGVRPPSESWGLASL